jgi:hypothetical protein
LARTLAHEAQRLFRLAQLCLGGFERCARRVKLLLGNRALLVELLGAFEVRAGEFEVRAGGGDGLLGLLALLRACARLQGAQRARADSSAALAARICASVCSAACGQQSPLGAVRLRRAHAASPAESATSGRSVLQRR